MGAPLLLSADRWLPSKKCSQARQKGRDEPRWQQERFLTVFFPLFSSLLLFLDHFVRAIHPHPAIIISLFYEAEGSINSLQQSSG